MSNNKCLLSFANIVSQFLAPRVWKQAHQAWPTAHAQSRWKLPAVVWVLLGMAWCCGDSVEERFATARAVYVAHHQKTVRPGKTLQGFLKALRRLPMPVLRALSGCMREQFADLVEACRINGWVPLACDGTRLNCPRSEELQKHLGQSAQKGSPPMVFLTAMVLLPLGLPWVWRWGRGNADEHQHLRHMLPHLPPRSLLVLDALYTSFSAFERLNNLGISFLVRVTTRSILYVPEDGLDDAERMKRINDRVVHYWPGDAAYKLKKLPIRARLLRIRGKKGDVWLLTNIFDRAVLSRKSAAEIYRWRWRNEGLFRQYKRLLNKVKLASRTVALVHREGEGAMLALQLLLAHAAKTMPQHQQKIVVIVESPRQTLLIIRAAMTAALCQLGPRQRVEYQRMTANVRCARRQRISSRVRQKWTRRREHKPPKPPKVRVMGETLKAKWQQLLAAA